MALSVRDHLDDRLEALLADCDPIMNSADFGQTIHDLDERLPCRLIKARNGTQHNDGIGTVKTYSPHHPVIALRVIPGFHDDVKFLTKFDTSVKSALPPITRRNISSVLESFFH